MANPKIAQRMSHIPPSGIRKVFDEAARLRQEGKSIINFQIGRPDYDTPDHIKGAAKDALDAGFVHYTSNYGIIELREAIAHKLKVENDLEVDPHSELIVTVGANEAVMLAMLALIDPGDEVLIPNPAWAHYYYCIRLAGGIPVNVPLRQENGFQLDPDDVKQRITPRTKMLAVNTPHNPTGTVLNRETLETLAEIADTHDLLVVSDEIYDRFIYTDQNHVSFATLPGMRERTLTVNGFSKTYSMTGWRLGYIAAPSEFVQYMIRIHQYTVTSACAFAQKGGVAALMESQSCVEDMVAEFHRRRNLVVETMAGIPEVNLVSPAGAFYAFPKVRVSLSDEELSTHLLHEFGVAVVPGSVFGEYGNGHLRFAFSCSYQDVEEGMQRFVRAIQKLRENK